MRHQHLKGTNPQGIFYTQDGPFYTLETLQNKPKQPKMSKISNLIPPYLTRFHTAEKDD